MPYFLIFTTPLLATAIGILGAHGAGVSYLAFLPNFAAFILGSVFYFLTARSEKRIRQWSDYLGCTAIMLVAATLFFPGFDSVHRWLPPGPLSLNASMAFAPAVLFAIFYSRERMALTFVAITSSIYVLQPDAGQATAFALGAATIFWRRKSLHIVTRGAGALIAFTGAAASWLQSDPLTAVPHVERILHLLAEAGVMGVLGMSAALMAIFVTPFRSPNASRDLKLAYFSFLAGSFIVTEVGNFPVPLIGAGAAPVLGWFLMMRFLSVSRHADERLPLVLTAK